MNDELSLNEKVQVVASFSAGLNRCHPLLVSRPNGREIRVSEIGLYHRLQRGRDMIHIFDVTDGSADYRLELNGHSLSWHLTREADHYAG